MLTIASYDLLRNHSQTETKNITMNEEQTSRNNRPEKY